jgi:integral membrane protein
MAPVPDRAALHRAIGRLRVIAFLEGVSYLLLLGIAMPLKYLAGMPTAVRVTGLAHGLLFIAFVAAVIHVAAMLRWDRSRIIGALVASVVPFGTFVLDRRLRDDQSRVAGDALAANG